MIRKLSLTLFAGALSVLAVSSFAHAALSGDAAITARKACMKAHIEGVKTMVPMFKGEKPYDAAVIVGELDKMDKDCAQWADYWPKDSMTSTTQKTHAAEAIWSDPKGFDAAATVYYNAYLGVKATKDEAGFKAAFPALSKSCGGCHEKFRTPME
jgi:cytochrome c556